jgi:hypothetical protein
MPPVNSYLEITSAPAGASVLIDGKGAGRTNLRAMVSPGVHAVVVSGPGNTFQVKQMIDVKSGQTQRMHFPLTPAPSSQQVVQIPDGPTPTARSETPVVISGDLEITSTPPDAAVTIDGTPAGSTPVRASVSLGVHDVAVTKPNYISAARRVDVAPRAGPPAGSVMLPTSVDFTLQPDTATLAITSAPPGAAISIDNRPINGRTPIQQLPVQPGIHQIVAKLASFRDESQQIAVTPGERKTLSFTMYSLCDINRDGKVDILV